MFTYMANVTVLVLLKSAPCLFSPPVTDLDNECASPAIRKELDKANARKACEYVGTVHV